MDLSSQVSHHRVCITGFTSRVSHHGLTFGKKTAPPKKKCVLITGGGTGGHIYPALALAQAIESLGDLDSPVSVEMVGSQQGLEKDIFPRYPFPFHLLRTGKWNQQSLSEGRGRRLLSRGETLFFLFFAVLRCLWILWKKRPYRVIGMGGYASFPLLWTACFFGYKKKTALWEANTVPGLANRYLIPKVRFVYLHFPETQKYFQTHQRQKTQVVGFPLRKELEAALEVSSEALPQEPAEEPFFSVLVIGGSQGSVFINDLMVSLWQNHRQKMQGIRVIHQTGAGDYSRILKRYGSLLSPQNAQIEVHSYFHSPIEAYSRTHLVLCRAGAGTLAELAAQRKAALLLPLPHSANDHQKKNALYLREAGAASMMLFHELNAQSLLEAILSFKENPQKRQSHRRKIGLFYKREVARRMAGDFMSKEV